MDSISKLQLTQHCKKYTPKTQPKTLLRWKIFLQICSWLVSEENICTAPFLDAQELHSWSTWKANAYMFLYISVRKCLFQRRMELLSGGGINNIFKAVRCLGLVKCFKIFHFNWNFRKFNYFSASQYFHQQHWNAETFQTISISRIRSHYI